MSDIKTENTDSEVVQSNTLGEILRKKRQDLGVEIADASGYLKVRVSDIEAIENDELKNISKGLYAVGLIRSYIKFLKIDTKEIEEKIESLPIKYNFKSSKHRLINLDRQDKLSPSKDSFLNFLLISILLFLVLLLLYNSYENRDSLITNKNLIKELRKIEP